MKKVVFTLALLGIIGFSNAQWVQTSFPSQVFVNCFAVSGTNIFAGTYGGGVFLSTNNGSSWVPVNTGLTDTLLVTSLVVSGTNIFAGTVYGGVFLTTDNGSNWTEINTGLTNTNVRSLAVSGTNIFAGTVYGGVFLTTDNGSNWTQTGLTNSDIQTLLVCGSDIFAGTEGAGIFRTTDNGNSWVEVNTGMTNAEVQSLAVSGANIFAATWGGGVFLSINNGDNWIDANTGLTDTCVRSLAVIGSNIFAGTVYNGIWKRPLSDFNSYTISGNVFNDINNNGVKDFGEKGLANVLIKTKADNWFFNTDNNGDYTANSFYANDTLCIANSSPYSTVTPLAYAVTAGDTGKNFAVHFIPNIKDVRLTVTNLTPTRPGFDDKIRVTYENVGTDTMSGNVTLGFNSSLTYKSSVPAETSVIGNTVSWDYTNLIPFEKRNIDVLFNVPATVPIGTMLIFSGNIYPVIGDTLPLNNFNGIEQVVTGAIDPNEKEVIPDSGFTPMQLAAGEKLVYAIHFQNTGTDTAFNVKVVDTLSANVDAGTFEMLASSHPCSFTIRGAGIVEFNFPNILLPDSNVNLIGSNGFVKYAVKPKGSLLLGDSVTNTSYIFFDYNSAVQTNTTSTLIHEPWGLEEAGTIENGIYIYPNPANSVLSIEFGVMSISAHLTICNILGSEIISKTFTGNKTRIDVSNLRKGLYLLKVESDEGIAVRRFVKE